MKAKLSALSLAVLPVLASTAIDNQASLATPYHSDSIIVVYKENISKDQKRNARNLVLAKISDLNADEVDDAYRNLLNGRIANFKLEGMSSKDALKKIRNHPAVLYAEPDYIVSVGGLPDDTRFDDLWGMHNTGQTGGVDDADIDAPEAWEISTGTKDVVVGVIDSGIDHSHPDLNGNMWVNPGEIAGDGVDNDGNGYVDDIYGINAITGVGDPMDDQGHGTHVAGTIGATGNNAEGVVGVNHTTAMVGCKFLSAAGTGSSSDAIKCIDYMVGLKNSGVNLRVINNSWGGGGFSQAVYDAITASQNADMLFVAAAGNDAVDNDVNPHYPSSYDHPSILAVAGSNHTDGMYSDSQWGLTSVDMAAPGRNVLSTVPGNRYATFSGTSMATPHVAGAAALALSVNPELSTQELKALLMTTGDDNAATQGRTVSGKRLNVFTALENADPTPGFTLKATPGIQTIVAGDTATYEFSVGSIAEWQGDVTLTLAGNLEGASLSASTVTPGTNFQLSVPTTGETQWGAYNFEVTGTNGELVKTAKVNLNVNPQGLNDFDYSKTEGKAIPDNNADGITSTLTIGDELTIFNSNVYVDISHTWIGDLSVALTSPEGTTAILHNKVGGNGQNIQQTFTSNAFNGESTLGDWVLTVADHADDDTGTLNNWSITITGTGEVAPSAPEAGFGFAADGLTVNFTDNSSDRNNDIVSWAWDFGDDNQSTEQNPIHNYAETGNYDVTLTVTDSEGFTSSKTMSVSVSSTVIEAQIARAYKSRLGNLRVDLTWQGTAAEAVDIYRNGVKIDSVQNNGIYRDRERRVTGNQFIYKVCDASTACSNELTVNFN